MTFASAIHIAKQLNGFSNNLKEVITILNKMMGQTHLPKVAHGAKMWYIIFYKFSKTGNGPRVEPSHEKNLVSMQTHIKVAKIVLVS